MSNIQYFCDRDFISSLPDDLCASMKMEGLITPDHCRVHFCGFFSWHGVTAVFLPMNTEVNQKSDIAAYYLLQAINRYYSERSVGVQSENNELLIGGSLLALAITLLDDYIVNGLYVRRERRHTINNGKISWPRTISRYVPFSSSQGTPIYFDYASSHINYMSDCETARIQAYVIKSIISIFGPLLFAGEVPFDDKLQTTAEPIGDCTAQISHLNKELSVSYSERDIILIELLKQYLEKMDGTNFGALIIGTRYFHNMWESMLGCALAGIEKFNKTLPVPYYLSGGIYHETAEKGQRTDIVIASDDQKHFAVVDAKYYSAQSPKSAPGWPDLVKQFFYQKAVGSVVEQDVRVSTHFIFPGSEKKLVSAHVGYRGQHGCEVFNSTEGYPVIHCHYCDTVMLMQAYVLRRKMPWLINEILDVMV